jgi:uncharacterized membrane protein
MKTTILGGALFLVPFATLAIILGQAFEMSMLIAAPVDGLIPLKSVADIAFVNLIAIALIILICYVAGKIAKGGLLSKRVNRLDSILIDTMPGYAVTKVMVGGFTGETGAISALKPALVRFDDYEQIAFEIERDADKAVVFLPGSPSAWSGSSVIIDIARVTILNLSPHQTVSLLRVMGRGLLKVEGVLSATAQ